MSRKSVAVIFGAALAALLSGCASDSGSSGGPQEPPPVTDLILRNWTATVRDPLRECRLSLQFQVQGNVSGSTTAGSIFGKYRADGANVTMYDIDLNPRSAASPACGRRVVAQLGRVVGFSVKGMRLALYSEGMTSPIVMSTEDVAASTMAPALVGLSEGFAERVVTTNDLEFRVAAVDGQERPLLLDFRSWRINVRVNAGIVTQAYVG